MAMLGPIPIELFERREFKFSLAQDRYVRISVFPQSEKLPIGLPRRGHIALKAMSPAKP